MTRIRSISTEPSRSISANQSPIPSDDETASIKDHPIPLHQTVLREQVPTWLADNKWILSGYRQVQGSYKGCLMSLFYLHNETGNVYTHLVGAILFMVRFASRFELLIEVVSILIHVLCTYTHSTREWFGFHDDLGIHGWSLSVLVLVGIVSFVLLPFDGHFKELE